MKGKVFSVLLAVLFLAACAAPPAESQGDASGSEPAQSALSAPSSSAPSPETEEPAGQEALTQAFLAYAKEEYGYNRDEPEPTATFLGEKTVDGETWYLFSYDVSFLPGDSGHFLVSPTLDRVYRAAEGDFGSDVWFPCRDPRQELLGRIGGGFGGILREEFTDGEIQLIDAGYSFLSLAAADWGRGGSVSPALAVVNGRTCLLSDLSEIRDLETTRLATYALTVDGTQLWRLNEAGDYELVLERDDGHGLDLTTWVGTLEAFPQTIRYENNYLGEGETVTDGEQVAYLMEEVVGALRICREAAEPDQPLPENGGYQLAVYQDPQDAQPVYTLSLEPCYITLDGTRYGPFQVENGEEIIAKILEFF